MKKYTKATREDCRESGISYPNQADHHNVLVKMEDERTLLEKLMLKSWTRGLKWVSPEEVK